MNGSRRRLHRIRPAVRQFNIEQASARREDGKRWIKANERSLVFMLRTWLLILPSLVVLSMIDPTGLLLKRVLLGPSPVVWAGWAIACFWAGLSAAELAERSGCKLLIRGNNEAFFSVLGLVNCASVVGLLWLAARS